MKSTSRYIVPSSHPAFAGHFPGNPMVPGAVLLDLLLFGISRVSGLDMATCEIQSVKFLSPVLPGEELEFRHESIAGESIRFEIVSGPRKIAIGSLKTAVK